MTKFQMDLNSKLHSKWYTNDTSNHCTGRIVWKVWYTSGAF